MLNRFAITMIGKDGNRTLALDNNGPNHFDSHEAAEAYLTQMLSVNHIDTLKQVFGDYTKLRVNPVLCYDNGDATKTVF